MQQQLTGSDRVSSSDTTTCTNNSSTIGQQSVIKSSVKGSPTASSLSPTSAAAAMSSNVPLLSGQIVAQLNALLFSIHGLADKCIEAKVGEPVRFVFRPCPAPPPRQGFWIRNVLHVRVRN
jgi:hypothetical protein